MRPTVAHGFQEFWIHECPGSRHPKLVNFQAHLGSVWLYTRLKCSSPQMAGATGVSSSQAATPAAPPSPRVCSGAGGSQAQVLHSIPVLLEGPPQDHAAVLPIGAAGSRLCRAGRAAIHISWRANVQARGLQRTSVYQQAAVVP